MIEGYSQGYYTERKERFLSKVLVVPQDVLGECWATFADAHRLVHVHTHNVCRPVCMYACMYVRAYVGR